MQSMPSRKAGCLLSLLMSVSTLPFMSGCGEGASATAPEENRERETAYANIQETIHPQDAELFRFISEGYPQMEGEVHNTSWGSVVRVIIGDDYFSAAGGVRRRATIVADDERTEIVLKKLDDGSWERVQSIL